MKKHGFTLNMKDDTLEVEDRKVELDTTSSDHYYLPLKQCEVEVEEVCMSMEDKSFEEKFKIVTKLHRQFAHPSAKNLKALLKTIQLILGIDPNLPSISSNKLPAMEDIEVSDILRKHLNTLHAARHTYVKSESDERIRRALRHPVRATKVEFNQGDKVFYKRDNSNRWRGPGSIIGVDRKVTFIKHGSRLIRVPKC